MITDYDNTLIVWLILSGIFSLFRDRNCQFALLEVSSSYVSFYNGHANLPWRHISCPKKTIYPCSMSFKDSSIHKKSIRFLTHKSNMHNMAYNIWYCGISLCNLKWINLSLIFVDENVFDFYGENYLAVKAVIFFLDFYHIFQ